MSAIQQVKDAELKAKAIVDKAKAESGEIVKAAGIAAANLEEEAQSSARGKGEAAKSDYVKSLSDDYQKRKELSAIKCGQLKDGAMANVDKAREFVVGRIL